MNGFGFNETLQGKKNLPFPFFKVSDMNAEGASITVSRAANTVDVSLLKTLRAKTYPAGTVIFPKVGGALLTNKKRILGTEATFDNNIMGIVPKLVEKDWIYYWILTIDLKTLANTQALPSIRQSDVANLEIPLPPVSERRRILAVLDEQMKAVEQARCAVEEQIQLFNHLVVSILRESIANGNSRKVKFKDFAVEIKKGIGNGWQKFPVLGATRSGLALAKEPVGKKPERYKHVEKGTIFYNPMRILLGSIAMVDEDDDPGITSPDYVVFKGKEGILNSRWLYQWLRSYYGESLIKSLARGAVRERILFNRLENSEIELPDWETQSKAAEQFKIISETHKVLKQQLEAINNLPSTLLRKTFAGGI